MASTWIFESVNDIEPCPEEVIAVRDKILAGFLAQLIMSEEEGSVQGDNSTSNPGRPGGCGNGGKRFSDNAGCTHKKHHAQGSKGGPGQVRNQQPGVRGVRCQDGQDRRGVDCRQEGDKRRQVPRLRG